MKKHWFILSLLILLVLTWKESTYMSINAQEPTKAPSSASKSQPDKKILLEKPTAGKQVLCEMELPASTSMWGGKIADLGIDRPLHDVDKEKIHYWIFIPKDTSAKSAEGFPLLLFLHGAGEVGPDPVKVKMHGPPKLLASKQSEHWPFLTVSPQCTGGKYWSPSQLLLMLDKLETQYPIDKSRIYVTGLSMGGFGTWMLLKRAPNRFAAAVPICGGGDTHGMDKLINIPIAVFHGDADGAVDPQYSRDLTAALRKAGSKQVDLTMYMNVNHDSWTQTYNNPKLYEWLLKQKKK